MNKKDPRTEKIVAELKETVARLNKLDAILKQLDVKYTLHRTNINEQWTLTDIIQKVEY